MQELLTIDEGVALLRVSKPLIYKLTSTKEIPHFKMGTRLVFGREDLMNWLEEHKVEAKKSPLSGTNTNEEDITMAVILQAQQVGEIIDDLQKITDLAGTAEKQSFTEGELFRIRVLAKRITARIYDYGRVNLDQEEDVCKVQ